MGNKLGKLLKVDVVTSAAIRGRYARLCIQINMAYPFQYARCVKIGAFWQAIIYENLPMLCYRCGRLGHREVHCTEISDELKATFPPGLEPHREQGTTELEHPHTPWKTVQTQRSRPRGTNIESHPRGKLLQCNTYPPINQRGFTASTKSHVISKQQAGSVIGYEYEESGKTAGFNQKDVELHGENHDLLQPRELPMEHMQASHMNSCPRLNQISYTSQGLKTLENKRDSTHHKPT